MSAELKSTEDLLQLTPGESLGSSDWLKIDQDRINTFAATTFDTQWIHVDVGRAAAGPFGTTIAHGYLLLSLVPYLLDQVVVVTDSQDTINLGIDSLRFREVVKVNARVRLHVGIHKVRKWPTGGVWLQLKLSMEIEGESKPAFTGVVSYLHR